MSTKKTKAALAAAPEAVADTQEAAALAGEQPSAANVAVASPVITPTVSRRVHFWANEEHQAALGVFDAQQPCDAGVIYVWGDRCVNLEVTGPSGAKVALQNVRLLQGDEQPNEGESYAAWMDYQRAQAAQQGA